MRILSLLCVYLMVLDSQGAVSIPAPENPEIWSNNFIHILKWSPGKGTQAGTVYNVKIGSTQVSNIRDTTVDITKYMKDIYISYNVQLWASFGNRSSSIVPLAAFQPFTKTTIGPATISLSGCGDCLNVSIDLPKRQSNAFYNAILFDIYWKKVINEKDECPKSLTSYHSKSKSMPYSFTLRHLQPGQRYCVKVQPKTNSDSQLLLSSCNCGYTSQIETRGVAFLVGWVVGSVLIGSCFLGFIFSLVYAGFLCKPNVGLPRVLIILVPSYFLSPEETCISVAEVEYGVLIHKPKDQHQKKTPEKSSALHQQNSGDVDEGHGSDDVDDEEEEEDDDSHHGYMDRGGHGESESTSRKRPTSVCEDENPEGSSFEGTPTDTKDLSQPQHYGSKYHDQSALLSIAPTNVNAPDAPKEGQLLGGQMKEKEYEEDEDDCGNVNLSSVVLKSMQPDDEESKEASEAKEPLLALLLEEIRRDSLTAAKPQTGSSSELHKPLLIHKQPELPSSQQEDENDVSDTSVCDHVSAGYMASHTGTIDKENCSSEDEDEDYSSGYMTR